MSLQRPDGSFFLDVDGTAFEHVLRYLRHDAFPLFYDETYGHQFQMYAVVAGLAEHLGIDALIGYVKSEQYMRAVRIGRQVNHYEFAPAVPNALNVSRSASMKARIFPH